MDLLRERDRLALAGIERPRNNAGPWAQDSKRSGNPSDKNCGPARPVVQDHCYGFTVFDSLATVLSEDASGLEGSDSTSLLRELLVRLGRGAGR